MREKTKLKTIEEIPLVETTTMIAPERPEFEKENNSRAVINLQF